MQNIFDPLIKVYKTLYLFAYDITGNFGLALVLLSFFTFVVLYPFNKKAQEIQNKEHKIQSVLSPQIDEIKKQYSGREQYEQLQWLYQRYGYHPLYAIRSALGLIFQIPFLTAAYYMLSGLVEIQGVPWGFIPNLGASDHLLGGINVLPFVMTFVTVVYAFVMPGIHKKEQLQTIFIGFFFLVLLYSAPSALLIFWTCNLLWSLLDSVLGKKLEWIGKYIEENEMAFHIIFTLSLTVALLVPTEIYIKNASQLWFDLKDIGKFFLLDTIKYVAILFAVYSSCWKSKVRYYFLAILLGLLLGVFLESFIIGLDYGTFDGHEINWDNLIGAGIVNTVIWVLCLGASIVGFYRLAHDERKLKKVIKPISFFVVFIQCVVLLIILKNNPIQKHIVVEDGIVGVLTNKNMYTVSSKDNIIVFLLDAFDASVFEEIQKRSPNVLQAFKDFTYYPDTISSFGFTHFSLPEILTGRLYDPVGNYPLYFESAWKDNPFYLFLKDNDYVINLFTSGNYVAKSVPVDNLITKKIEMSNITAEKFRNLVYFRIAPLFLKKIYYTYNLDIDNPETIFDDKKPYMFDDIKFFAQLKNGLKETKKKNAFQFYHLQGLHPPYIIGENVELLKANHRGTAYSQALGVLKIVKEYIEQMKKLNLYDKATFVIMADHGYHNTIGSRPLFLVKMPDSNNNIMVKDDTPMAVSELMPVIFQRFKPAWKEKDDLFRRKNKKKISNRFFYFENTRKDGKFNKYLVKSPAKNINCWVATGNIKKQFVTDKSYKIGERIDFSNLGNAYKYKGEGWGDKVETFGSIISQNKAELFLDIIDENLTKEDVFLQINCNALLNYTGQKIQFRDMHLFANETLIGSWRFSTLDTVTIECQIPKKIIMSKRVDLKYLVDNPKDNNQVVVFQINNMMISEK